MRKLVFSEGSSLSKSTKVIGNNTESNQTFYWSTLRGKK